MRYYKDLLLTFPSPDVLQLVLNVAEIASDVRSRYGARTPDEIQLATGLLGGATPLVTNDDQLKQVTELEMCYWMSCRGNSSEPGLPNPTSVKPPASTT